MQPKSEGARGLEDRLLDVVLACLSVTAAIVLSVVPFVCAGVAHARLSAWAE